MKVQRCLDKLISTFKQFSFNCHFTNSSPKSIIPLKPKTPRREYLDETVGIILALREAGRLYTQIADQIKVPRPSVVHILYQATRTQNELYRLTKRAGRLSKLNTWARQALICYVERYPHDNLGLGTSSKSDTTLSRKIVRAYLKTAGYLRFKA